MKINNSLKKIAGEELAKFLALNFNQEKVLEIIKELFNNNGRDIRNIKTEDFDRLKLLINSLDKPEEIEQIKDTRTAIEILKEKGYQLIQTPTYESYLPFTKYFRNNEILCKFNDTSRAKNYNLFWIIKENIEEINPSDKPTRQDEYSTSICSIGISKDGRNITQITSRYNHSVNGCDNTFNSNLDNIAEGLTEAFNKDYNFNINKKNNLFEFDKYVFIDNKYVHYRQEINGVKIGNNTLVTDKIINFDSNTHHTYDYFIINLQTCKIVWNEEIYGNTIDGFVPYFNENVKKIVFVNSIENLEDNDDSICYILKEKW